jgi:hypothetical protein
MLTLTITLLRIRKGGIIPQGDAFYEKVKVHVTLMNQE